MSTQEQTAAVLKHHLDSFLASDFPTILSHYTDDSVIITPAGTFKGVAELQEAIGQMIGLFTPENLSQMQMLRQDIQGEVAFVAWTMGDAIPFGTDTFVIRNGKIAVQTMGMHLPQ